MALGFVRYGLSLVAGDLKAAGPIIYSKLPLRDHYDQTKAKYTARNELRDGLKDVYWLLERDKVGGIRYGTNIEKILIPLVDPDGRYTMSLGEGSMPYSFRMDEIFGKKELAKLRAQAHDAMWWYTQRTCERKIERVGTNSDDFLPLLPENNTIEKYARFCSKHNIPPGFYENYMACLEEARVKGRLLAVGEA